MSDVQFTEEEQYTRPRAPASQPKGLIAIVIALGLATDERDAVKVLLFVFAGAIMLTGIAVLFLMNAGLEAPPPPRNMPLPGVRLR